MNSEKNTQNINSRPLIIAGILLGLGQGGFFDGIVFHQLLQWHHMFSNIESTQTIAGLELNTLGDGLFHVFDWLMTIAGIIALWLAVKKDDVTLSTSTLIGSLAIGAGLFNVVEGILSHHLLQIHHVKPGNYQLTWDLAFIDVGILAIAIGWLILRLNKNRSLIQK
jgi:uncharacterized membrane protein